MSILRAGFPDAENVLCTLLEQVAPTYTRAPEELPEQLIIVQRLGGPNNEHSDYPIIQISVLALATATQTTPRDVAWSLAEQCRQIILASTRSIAGGALIDAAENVTPVTMEPDDNPDVRRVVATYELELRRPQVTIP